MLVAVVSVVITFFLMKWLLKGTPDNIKRWGED